jgi:phage N-6-adenine-methyltransferase
VSALDMFPEAKVDPGVDLDRRYTTRETMDLCMRLAGVDAWDLDVAADEESHWATMWFGVEQNGLKQPWHGRVWCNPPYSDISPWVRRANYHVLSGLAEVVAMLLPCNRTEQSWWQENVESVRDRPRIVLDEMYPRGGVARAGYQELRTHFLPGRVKFGHPGNRDAVGVGSPPFGCVLLVWRRP